ncbi:MAG: hypothetical protein ABIR59_07595, partial [Gemmatimonadales bacterium]
FLSGCPSAPPPPAVLLKPANAVHPAEFSGIARVRELSDGRLIVLDSAERKLFVVSFTTGDVAPLGRVGDGPEEYRFPIGLFALPGDSTVVTDGQTRRLIIFRGDRPAATVPAEAPVMDAVKGFIIGADPAGNIAKAFRPRGLGRPTDQGDSIIIARYSRAEGRGDTLARMRSGFGGAPGSANENTPAAARAAGPIPDRQYMYAPVIGDQAIGFPDGWIAVARMEPYRVDWIDPLGKMFRGPPIPVSVTPLNDNEKRFYLARMAKLDGKPAGNLEDIKDWRSAIPPFWGFYNAALYQAPGGSLLIARAPTAALPTPTYDLVNRRGAYLGQLVLPVGQRVAGFGARSIYVVVVDTDGLETLQRHPWP